MKLAKTLAVIAFLITSPVLADWPQSWTVDGVTVQRKLVNGKWHVGTYHNPQAKAVLFVKHTDKGFNFLVTAFVNRQQWTGKHPISRSWGETKLFKASGGSQFITAAPR